MNNIHDSIGKTYGRLTLLSFHEKRRRKSFGLFLCLCGKEHIADFSAVARGAIKSCGCLAIETVIALGRSNATHGMSKTPEFRIWSHMVQRCTNENDKSYQHYGARGITVCAEWCDFSNFYRDMGPRPSAKHSIDRIDVNGNYEPSNCKWSTDHEQARNKTNTVFVTVDGKNVVLQDAICSSGISRETVKSRVQRGMDINKALAKPPNKVSRTRRNEIIEMDGVRDNAAGWALRSGIPYKTLLYRLNAGWDERKALTEPIRKWPTTSLNCEVRND